MFYSHFSLDDVPTEPLNVQAQALSPTSIKITWDPPANTKGLLVKYELFYYPVGGKDDKVLSFTFSFK